MQNNNRRGYAPLFFLAKKQNIHQKVYILLIRLEFVRVFRRRAEVIKQITN